MHEAVNFRIKKKLFKVCRGIYKLPNAKNATF